MSLLKGSFWEETDFEKCCFSKGAKDMSILNISIRLLCAAGISGGELNFADRTESF